jgi:hypothetical protein
MNRRTHVNPLNVTVCIEDFMVINNNSQNRSFERAEDIILRRIEEEAVKLAQLAP